MTSWKLLRLEIRFCSQLKTLVITHPKRIWIPLRCGICFDLGGKNRLSSVSYGGGDATGGNVSNTYSYTNFNDLDVTQVGHNSTLVMGTGGTSLPAALLAAPYSWGDVAIQLRQL